MVLYKYFLHSAPFGDVTHHPMTESPCHLILGNHWAPITVVPEDLTIINTFVLTAPLCMIPFPKAEPPLGMVSLPPSLPQQQHLHLWM